MQNRIQWVIWNHPLILFFSSALTILASIALFLNYQDKAILEEGPLIATVLFFSITIVFFFIQTKVTLQKEPFLVLITHRCFGKEIFKCEASQDFAISIDPKLNKLIFHRRSNPSKDYSIVFVFNFLATKRYVETISTLRILLDETNLQTFVKLQSHSRIPWLTISLIISNILTIPFWKEDHFLNRAAVSDFDFWKFITYFFAHGSFIHLFMNMTALFDLGHKLEVPLGRIKFLFIYLLSGLFSGAYALLWMHTDESLVGSSGAVFGLMGAIYFLSHNAETSAHFSKLSKVDLVLCVLISFVPGVSLSAHLGGFVVGWLFSWFFRKSVGLHKEHFFEKIH